MGNMVEYSRQVKKDQAVVHEEQQTCEALGAKLRAVRKAQGVTQAQLAALVGTGTRFISELENGKTTAEIGKTLAVIQALGLGLFVFSPWENK